MLSTIRERAEAAPQSTADSEPVGAEKLLHIEFDLQGETLSASVVCRILTTDQTIKRDRALVQLSAPERYDDLPAMSKLRIYALATLSQALLDPPEWLDEWAGRYDPLLFAVYEEVAAHERSFFHGHVETSEEGEEPAPIVRIRSLDPPPPA